MTVEILYFKNTGKYYTTGKYETQKEHMFQIFEEVKNMFRNGEYPGLIGKGDFYALVSCPEHKCNYPTLIIPENL